MTYLRQLMIEDMHIRNLSPNTQKRYLDHVAAFACPKCQYLDKAKWLQARQAEILPVPYFHVVFTLPDLLAPLALQNKRVRYHLLFQAASQTLLTIAANNKHLGAEIGFLTVLHTWGQNLMHHPHLHCLVPGGGLSADMQQWIPCHSQFFLPVRFYPVFAVVLSLPCGNNYLIKGSCHFMAASDSYLTHEISNNSCFPAVRKNGWCIFHTCPPPYHVGQ